MHSLQVLAWEGLQNILSSCKNVRYVKQDLSFWFRSREPHSKVNCPALPQGLFLVGIRGEKSQYVREDCAYQNGVTTAL